MSKRVGFNPKNVDILRERYRKKMMDRRAKKEVEASPGQVSHRCGEKTTAPATQNDFFSFFKKSLIFEKKTVFQSLFKETFVKKMPRKMPPN